MVLGSKNLNFEIRRHHHNHCLKILRQSEFIIWDKIGHAANHCDCLAGALKGWDKKNKI